MTWEVDFTEAVAVITEDGDALSQKGLDTLFDILEHLCDGGTVENFSTLNRDEVVTMLAVVWTEARYSVLSYEG